MNTTRSVIQYRQAADGQYQLCRGEDVLCSMPEVAICFDASGEQVVLHRHGDPVDVQAWVEQRKKELQMKGYRDRAENLTVIKNVERWIPVEELNAMIHGSIEGLETAHCQRLPGPR